MSKKAVLSTDYKVTVSDFDTFIEFDNGTILRLSELIGYEVYDRLLKDKVYIERFARHLVELLLAGVFNPSLLYYERSGNAIITNKCTIIAKVYRNSDGDIVVEPHQGGNVQVEVVENSDIELPTHEYAMGNFDITEPGNNVLDDGVVDKSDNAEILGEAAHVVSVEVNSETGEGGNEHGTANSTTRTKRSKKANG